MEETNPKAMVKEIYEEVYDLMKQENWLEAHRVCLRILRSDPENFKVIHLKNKIEKVVKKMNKKIIQNDIRELKPLWKEKKYREILEKLKALAPYSNDFPQIAKLLLKARSKYEKEIRAKNEQYFKGQNAISNQQFYAGKFAESLATIEKLRELESHGKEIEKSKNRICKAWVDSELDKNNKLLESEKYEEILSFCQQLLHIDSKSQKVIKLIDKTKKQYQSFKIDERRDFIYKSLEQIRILYQLKKYQKVVDATAEILAIDPRNKEANSFHQKSLAKLTHITNNEIVTQMLNAKKQLKEEYKADKKNVAKI